MIGIYKITSPSGRVYIGQTTNVDARWSDYDKLFNCKTQIKLYRSFLKYGVIHHNFEFIEECNEIDLNYWERYYQDKYDVLTKGLNCKLTSTTDKLGRMSEETKKKISTSSKGKINSLECRLKLSGPRKDYKKINGDTYVKSKRGGQNHKKVIDVETNIVYNSLKEASLIKGLNYAVVRARLSGCRPNYTNLEYYYGE